jgi:hypothetical protein
MHYVHNLSIVFGSDDRARGRSSFDAVGDIGGEAFVAAGYYEDVYARGAQGWKFLLHREVPFFFVTVKEGWAGPKPRIMTQWESRRPPSLAFPALRGRKARSPVRLAMRRCAGRAGRVGRRSPAARRCG